jgi:monofunctional glycosyltransferase
LAAESLGAHLTPAQFRNEAAAASFRTKTGMFKTVHQMISQSVSDYSVLLWLGIILAIIVVLRAHVVTIYKIFRLKHVDPHRSALMLQRLKEAETRGRQQVIDYKWVPLHEVSSDLVRAILLAEDPTFYSHHGFDWVCIYNAIRYNWKKKRLARGGSSITQQTAKNMFLHPAKTFRRKLREALITVEMEAILKKDRILEIYLNVIEFGDGIYGVEAAAKHYFGLPANRVGYFEAAFLATIIPHPRCGHTVLKLPDELKQNLERLLVLMNDDLFAAKSGPVN